MNSGSAKEKKDEDDDLVGLWEPGNDGELEEANASDATRPEVKQKLDDTRAEQVAAVQDLNQLPDAGRAVPLNYTNRIRPAAKKTKKQQEAEFYNLV